jgi:hypothetical protein
MKKKKKKLRAVLLCPSNLIIFIFRSLVLQSLLQQTTAHSTKRWLTGSHALQESHKNQNRGEGSLQI